MSTKKLTVKLNDAYDNGDGKEYLVDITIDELGIYIRPHGYSDCSSTNGNGYPIMLEIAEGKPHLLLWRNINQEDPTDDIDFEEALEDCRMDNS